MKKIKFVSLVSTALLSLTLPAWAGPRGGGGFHGGGFVGGGRPAGGSHLGGGSRAAPGFQGSSFRPAPAFRGAYLTGRSVATPNTAPRYYYNGTRMSAMRPRGFNRSLARSTSPSFARSASTVRESNRVSPIAGRNRATNPRISTATDRQPNRSGRIAGHNRISNSRTPAAVNPQTAANRQSFLKNHASERHDGNWHRDWDRHHSHFHHNKVFVFVNGFWWGLDPWFYSNYAYDYYPYDDYGYGYGYNPYDYSYGDAYDYSGNPYGYYNYAPYYDDDQSGYSGLSQSAGNSTVSAVQSELAKLGYYGGEIDGVIGDQTEAALARYQQDRDLSVTGTIDTATLQSLGLK